MSQKRRLHKGVLIAVIAVAAVIGSFFAADTANALSATAPDPSSSGGYGTSNSRFVLEKTGQNTVTSISVPVYLKNKPTGSVSMSVVNFKYPWAGVNEPSVSFQGGSYARGNRSFSIPRSSFTLDVSTGYYRAYATAKLNPSTGQSTYAVAEFRLRVNVSGGLIGIGGGKRYSTIPNNYYTTNNNNTYNYDIPFATPCTVSTNTAKTIYLDDLDSGQIDNRYNTITVQVYDETSGGNVSLTRSGSMGDGGTYNLKMTFRPGHKYRLLVKNVHANNTLVYTFPYDNIAYKVGCAWSLLGINSQNRVQKGGSGSFSSYGNYHSGSPRTVHPGDVVQFQHEVENSGNMKTSTFSRWRERSGWAGTSGWPQSGGTYQSTLNAGASARWPGAPTSYTIKTSDIGRTLCERYGVRAQSSTNSGTYRSTASCVYVTTDWSTTGTTTMKVNGVTKTGTLNAPTVVRIGDKINWTQTLKNNGPLATHRSITVGTLVQDYNATTKAVLNQAVFSAATIASGWASGATRSWQNGTAANGYTYTIKPTTYKADGSVNVKGDVGKTLCRRLQWDPYRWNDTSSALTYSTQRCVTVAYNFNLIPGLDGPSDSITPGGTIPDVRPSIRNQLASNPSQTTETDKNIRWQLGRIDIAPGGAIPAAAQNNQSPQAYYGPSWDPKDNATNVAFPPGTTLLDLLKNEIVPLGTAIGSKICFTLSVQPYSSTTTNWRHGEPLCIGVNARPTVQILGNDLRVGSAFQGGINLNAKIGSVVRNDYASWGEYGVIAPNTITNFASQSGGNGGASGSQAIWSKLTFANTGVPVGCATAYGCYTGATNLGTLPNVKSAVASVTYNGASINYNKGSASFKASDIPSIIAGANISNFTKSAAITTSGTITIDADIKYSPGNISGEGGIPQLILIANNINIKGNVKHIDAWLIATGTINTCNDVVPTALRSTNCSNQLTINGATMANRLLLNRTYFDSSDPSKAAETFNLQGSSYVWASNVARQNGVWQTVYSTDLPPRY